MRVAIGKGVPIAADRLAVPVQEFVWLVLATDEEYGIADSFDGEAEGLVFASDEAQKIPDGAAAAEDIDALSIAAGRCLGEHCPGCGLDGVLWVSGSVLVAIVVSGVLIEDGGLGRRHPERWLA